MYFLTITNWLKAGLIVLAFLVAAKIITYISQKYLIRWAKKSKTKLDDIIVEKIKAPFSYIMLLLGLKIALEPFKFWNGLFNLILESIVIIALVYILATFSDVIIKYWGEKFSQKTKSQFDDALLPLLTKIIKLVWIIVVVLWLLDKWEIDITPLLASLGIAGLALGFAVKDSLAHIFGGISLILDRSIKVGDKIQIESGEAGTIYDIGIRSTRLKTFSNEIIIIPNGQLANSRIKNFAQPLPPVRTEVNFNVEYGTAVEKVRKVVLDVIKTIKDIAEEPAPEVLFLELGDSSLNFRAHFWVADYNEAWNKKLEATEKIYKTLNEAKIGIPFPTRTIYLKK